MYLANDGSLGFLRLEHVEGHQELSLETKLFTILSTQAKQRWQRNATFTRSTWQYDYYASTCALQWKCKEVNALVHIGYCYNSLFYAEENTEVQCGFSMSACWFFRLCYSILGSGQMLGNIWCFLRSRCIGVLDYWPVSPHEGVISSNTLWARCFQGEGNVRNAISIWIIIVVLRFS